MQICQTHWDELRAAIKSRGLDHLVARSGAEAVASLKRQVEGEADPQEDFDPLMGANFAIWRAFLRDGGIAALTYPGCCLCRVNEQEEGLATDWIEGAALDQLAHARALGLVPEVQ